MRGHVWLNVPTIIAITTCGTSSESPTTASQRAPGALSEIAPMSTARAAHTVTLLRDGRVLVVGGLEAGRSVELFDPRDLRFVSSTPLRVARVGHTATMLSDGRVLIAGGYNGEYLSSTEIYDPERATFSSGPELLQPRSGHLAIALRDGRILFAGGVTTGYTFMSSAELYDPAGNHFVATGPMSVSRESHVGALLPDGSVLIAGGHTGRHAEIQLYASAERYDPVRGVFTATGSMARRRHKQAAIALPDGRVLITGGTDERDDQGQYRDAEVYDAATGRFAAIGEMQRSRYKHDGAMVLLRDGKVLLAGGSSAAEVFDPGRNVFEPVPGSTTLPGSFSAAVTLASGAVLITGGYGNGTGPRASAWLYTPR